MGITHLILGCNSCMMSSRVEPLAAALAAEDVSTIAVGTLVAEEGASCTCGVPSTTRNVAARRSRMLESIF